MVKGICMLFLIWGTSFFSRLTPVTPAPLSRVDLQIYIILCARVKSSGILASANPRMCPHTYKTYFLSNGMLVLYGL